MQINPHARGQKPAARRQRLTSSFPNGAITPEGPSSAVLLCLGKHVEWKCSKR